MEQSLADRKTAIRKIARVARKAVVNRRAVGLQVTDRLLALPEYQSARSVMWYIDVRDEVPTRHAILEALACDKRILVPFCVDGELELFALTSMEELEIGAHGILEPKESLRRIADSPAADRKPAVDDIDLIVVPGVAFGMDGGRIGHGHGYYDKLLSQAKPETVLVALAMQCQMFDEVPMQDHDIYMDKVVTEDNVYQGRSRR